MWAATTYCSSTSAIEPLRQNYLRNLTAALPGQSIQATPLRSRNSFMVDSKLWVHFRSQLQTRGANTKIRSGCPQSSKLHRLVRPSRECQLRLPLEHSGQHTYLHLPGIDQFCRKSSLRQRKLIVNRLMKIHEVEYFFRHFAGCVHSGSVQVIGCWLGLKASAFCILAHFGSSFFHQLAQEGDTRRTGSVQFAAMGPPQ